MLSDVRDALDLLYGANAATLPRSVRREAEKTLLTLCYHGKISIYKGGEHGPAVTPTPPIYPKPNPDRGHPFPTHSPPQLLTPS